MNNLEKTIKLKNKIENIKDIYLKNIFIEKYNKIYVFEIVKEKDLFFSIDIKIYYDKNEKRFHIDGISLKMNKTLDIKIIDTIKDLYKDLKDIIENINKEK